MKKLHLTLALLFSTLLTGGEHSEYQDLNELALNAGADKSSAWHNYTEIYAKYFANLKDKPIKFLEIGIYKGASVKLWENYFPAAELHFIDIISQPNTSRRSHFHFLDQSNPTQLASFIQSTGGQFDIIIDDGGHTMNQQITSFIHLFPALKSEGIYVIEDLHTSYWREFGGGGTTRDPIASKNSTINFLKNLIDDVNYVGAKTTRATHEDVGSLNLSYHQKNILSIHFYDSLCFILKR